MWYNLLVVKAVCKIFNHDIVFWSKQCRIATRCIYKAQREVYESSINILNFLLYCSPSYEYKMQIEHTRV